VTSLSRMRLFIVRFGYIAIFAYDIRDDERTIWCRARLGRGGPQCEAHAHWGRGGLAVTVDHCYGPIGGRGGPSPTGPHCHSPIGGRGGPSPAGPLLWSRRRKRRPQSCRAPLSRSRRRKGRPCPPRASLSWLMMRALYHPW
jgi:hypothetical protein